jgi:hypothetical protein
VVVSDSGTGAKVSSDGAVEAGAGLAAFAGATATGAATGAVLAGTVLGAAAGVEATWTGATLVLLVTGLAGFAVTGAEFVFVADWACGWSSSYNFCSMAARAAAWSGVSSARAERQVAITAAHKTTKMLVFIKSHVCTRVGGHH